MKHQRNPVIAGEDLVRTPRNKQAALVVRPASWINKPLPEPKYLPSPEEDAAEKLRQQERIAIEAMRAADIRKREVEERQRTRAKKAKPKVSRCNWAKHQLRAIHRRKGLPPPTATEIAAYKRQQPTFGRSL